MNRLYMRATDRAIRLLSHYTLYSLDTYPYSFAARDVQYLLVLIE